MKTVYPYNATNNMFTDAKKKPRFCQFRQSEFSKSEDSEQALVLRTDGDAENPGSLSPEGSACAVLKVHIIYVRAPKGRNIETDGPAACNPKFDNFGS